LELEFDAARREKTSFWGRGCWVGAVYETRSFNFRGFWGAELDGAAVDQRSAKESAINDVVWRSENLEGEMDGWMTGSKWGIQA
jgi:hypothetical protein